MLRPGQKRALSVVRTAVISVAVWFGARALCELALPWLAPRRAPVVFRAPSPRGIPRRANTPSPTVYRQDQPVPDFRSAGPARPASRPAGRGGMLPGLLAGVRFVSERDDEGVAGIRVHGVRPDSALALLGIADGDRIDSINGLSLADPAQALVLYARLPRERELRVRIRRDGNPLTLVIHIV